MDYRMAIFIKKFNTFFIKYTILIQLFSFMLLILLYLCRIHRLRDKFNFINLKFIYKKFMYLKVYKILNIGFIN